MRAFILVSLIFLGGCSVIEKQYNNSVWTDVGGQISTEELQKMFDEYNVKYFNGKLHCKMHWFKSKDLNGQTCILPWGTEIFIADDIDRDRLPKTLIHEMCHVSYMCLSNRGHCRGFRDEVRRVANLSGYKPEEIYWQITDYKDE